jgi:tetratricopeptide (TPR) repeat protein
MRLIKLQQKHKREVTTMDYYIFKKIEYLYLMDHDFAETITNSDSTIERTSHNVDLADAYLYRGTALMQSENLTSAWTDLEEATKRYHAAGNCDLPTDLNHVHALTNLGILAIKIWETTWTPNLFGSGYYISKAIANFTRAINIIEAKPQAIYPLPYLHRSLAYAKTLEIKEAIDDVNYACYSHLLTPGSTDDLTQTLHTVVRILLDKSPWVFCRFALTPDCSPLLRDTIIEILYAGIHGKIKTPTFAVSTEDDQKRISEFFILMLKEKRILLQKVDLQDVMQHAVKNNWQPEQIQEAILDKKNDIQEDINNFLLYNLKNISRFVVIKTFFEENIKKDSEKAGTTPATTYVVVNKTDPVSTIVVAKQQSVPTADDMLGDDFLPAANMVSLGSERPQPARYSPDFFSDLFHQKPAVATDSNIDTSVISPGMRLFL